MALLSPCPLSLPSLPQRLVNTSNETVAMSFAYAILAAKEKRKERRRREEKRDTTLLFFPHFCLLFAFDFHRNETQRDTAVRRQQQSISLQQQRSLSGPFFLHTFFPPPPSFFVGRWTGEGLWYLSLCESISLLFATRIEEKKKNTRLVVR
jgi:hypothetical protein